MLYIIVALLFLLGLLKYHWILTVALVSFIAYKAWRCWTEFSAYRHMPRVLIPTVIFDLIPGIAGALLLMWAIFN